MTDSWPWPTRRTSTNGGSGTTSGSDAGSRSPGTILRMRCSDVGFEDTVTMPQIGNETADMTSSLSHDKATASADNPHSLSSVSVDDPLVRKIIFFAVILNFHEKLALCYPACSVFMSACLDTKQSKCNCLMWTKITKA